MIRLSNLHVWILRGKRFVGKKGGENPQGMGGIQGEFFPRVFLITIYQLPRGPGCLGLKASKDGEWTVPEPRIFFGTPNWKVQVCIYDDSMIEAWKVTTHRKTLSLERSNKESITLWCGQQLIILWFNIYYIDKYDPALYRWFEQCHSKDGFWDE